ncbi:MAG: TIGR02300 family protein [Kiloniellales bacterium]
MTKPEWGRKRICHACGAVFYDMRRDPIVCPKCDTEFDPEAILKSRRGRGVVAKEAEPKAVVPEAVEAEDEAEGEVEEGKPDIEEDEETKADKEDTLLEDPSDLTEDDDDVAEVREHLDKSESN